MCCFVSKANGESLCCYLLLTQQARVGQHAAMASRIAGSRQQVAASGYARRSTIYAALCAFITSKETQRQRNHNQDTPQNIGQAIATHPIAPSLALASTLIDPGVISHGGHQQLQQ